MAGADMPGKLIHVRDQESDSRTELSAIDVCRAHANVLTDNSGQTFVMLPPEHPGHQQDMCGLLKKHMYWTRAAADGWQQACLGFLKSIGV